MIAAIASATFAFSAVNAHTHHSHVASENAQHVLRNAMSPFKERYQAQKAAEGINHRQLQDGTNLLYKGGYMLTKVYHDDKCRHFANSTYTHMGQCIDMDLDSRTRMSMMSDCERHHAKKYRTKYFNGYGCDGSGFDTQVEIDLPKHDDAEGCIMMGEGIWGRVLCRKHPPFARKGGIVVTQYASPEDCEAKYDFPSTVVRTPLSTCYPETNTTNRYLKCVEDKVQVQHFNDDKCDPATKDGQTWWEELTSFDTCSRGAYTMECSGEETETNRPCGCEEDDVAYCNFDYGTTGECERCITKESVEDCYNDGLPLAGADDCKERCF